MERGSKESDRRLRNRQKKRPYLKKHKKPAPPKERKTKYSRNFQFFMYKDQYSPRTISLCCFGSRKNNIPLFSAGMALAVGVWNYAFHPMRMTDAILPGHTSPGTIKPALTMLALSLPFLLTGSKVRPVDTRDNISLSPPRRFQQQTEGLFISRENISTFVPLLSLGDHFRVNYFSLLNQRDPEASG